MAAISEIAAPKRSFNYPTTVLQALLLTAICLDGVFLAAAVVVKVESLAPERERAVAAEHPAGEQAPDFTLRDPDGKQLHLHDVLGRRPLVFEFGSFTCLLCSMGRFDRKEEVARKYADHANFYFVYTHEAHPGGFGSMRFSDGAGALQEVRDWDERAERAVQFQEKKKVARHMLVDEDGDQSVQKLLGGCDNQLIVIDPDGRIALKQERADADQLDGFLAGYLGPVITESSPPPAKPQPSSLSSGG